MYACTKLCGPFERGVVSMVNYFGHVCVVCARTQFRPIHLFGRWCACRMYVG